MCRQRSTSSLLLDPIVYDTRADTMLFRFFPGNPRSRVARLLAAASKKKTKKIIINKHGKKNKSLPTRADTVRRVYKKCKKLIKQRFDVVDPAPPPTFNPGRWKPRDSVAAAVQYVFFRCCIVQYCFYTADSFWHLNAPTRRRFKTALSAKTAVHESIRHRVV